MMKMLNHQPMNIFKSPHLRQHHHHLFHLHNIYLPFSTCPSWQTSNASGSTWNRQSDLSRSSLVDTNYLLLQITLWGWIDWRNVKFVVRKMNIRCCKCRFGWIFVEIHALFQSYISHALHIFDAVVVRKHEEPRFHVAFYINQRTI